MRKEIVVVGSINLDLVVSVKQIPARGQTVTGASFQTFFGGKGANQAVGVARLGHPVSMIGRVGDDEFGRRLHRGLRAAGVRSASVKTARGVSSGVALIAVDARGHNSIVVIPGANAKLTPSDLENDFGKLRSAGIILTQLETPLETVECLAVLAARHKIPLILDPAPARELPRSLLRLVTWITPNETETIALCKSGVASLHPKAARQHARQLKAQGPQNVVIKMGSRGAYVATAGGAEALIPAFKVQAVDSTAAGDAFNAGLAVSLMKEMEAVDAVRYASAVAALSVTRPGAQPSMPAVSDVSRILRTSGRAHRSGRDQARASQV